jgi:RHS repeat-associated protein
VETGEINYIAQNRMTGKERDSNGLDYFGARYYWNHEGLYFTERWISPDAVAAHIYDPPTLNKYTYCRKDPINLVDPDGRLVWALDCWSVPEIGEYFGQLSFAGTWSTLCTWMAFGGPGFPFRDPEDDCDGLEEIKSYSPDPYPVDELNLSEGMKSALSCLRRAIAEVDGTLTVTSAYRPADYQTHLREVWDKYQIVKTWKPGRCTKVAANVRLYRMEHAWTR